MVDRSPPRGKSHARSATFIPDDDPPHRFCLPIHFFFSTRRKQIHHYIVVKKISTKYSGQVSTTRRDIRKNKIKIATNRRKYCHNFSLPSEIFFTLRHSSTPPRNPTSRPAIREIHSSLLRQPPPHQRTSAHLYDPRNLEPTIKKKTISSSSGTESPYSVPKRYQKKRITSLLPLSPGGEGQQARDILSAPPSVSGAPRANKTTHLADGTVFPIFP